MRFHVVSDVHGALDELALAADGCDVFVCLGDLLLYLDYEDPRQGAFAEMMGADNAEVYIALRTNKEFAAAREFAAKAWAQRSGNQDPELRRLALTDIVKRQYRETFAVMPSPALLTPGNVDLPSLWPSYLRPGHRMLDGEAIEVGGVRLGFVGGGLTSPYRTPNEVDPVEYARKVEAIGSVDVIFSHIPPAVAQLTYDIVARRFEVGSQALLDLIHQTQPRYAMFGHVHQPLASRFRIGRTECLNVGHFRASRRPFVIEL